MSREVVSYGTRFRVAATFVVMGLGALIMLAVALPSLFLARRLYSEVIGGALGSLVLRVWGIRFTLHYLAPLPARQVVFVSNHNSTLDVFTLIAIRLPRTRFFLGGWLKKFIPIWVVGAIIRIFWTVPQEYPEQRRRIFARAERILRRTGDSVYLSPEGKRIVSGDIGAFNRGAFHLATALQAPIVPIYFHIPPDVNPGLGVNARPGMLDVYFLPAIETSSWRVEHVDVNKERVRDLFVRVNTAMRANGCMPTDLTIAPVPAIGEAGVA